MKLSQFRKLIREEVRRVVKERVRMTEALDPNGTYRIDTDFEGGGITSEDIQKVSGDPVTAAMAVKQEAIKKLGGSGSRLFSVVQLDKDTYYITTGEEGVTIVGSPRSPNYGSFWSSPNPAAVKQMDSDSMSARKM